LRQNQPLSYMYRLSNTTWYPFAGAANSDLVLGTSVATTSGTSVTITGIPSWARRVTLTLNGVASGGNNYLSAQLGSGSIQTTGYTGTLGGTYATNASTTTSGSTYFLWSNTNASVGHYGGLVFVHVGSNTWILSGTACASNRMNVCNGAVTLTGTLDRISITDLAGIAFNAGAMNVLVE
jgi:hypothetical protein